MSLINFGKEKKIECANMQIEAGQPAPPPRVLVDPAKQQRAKLARIAESNWLELEAQLEQALAEVAEWRRRAEVAESESELLRDREAAAYRRADNDKERYRDALAVAMAAFTAAAPIMLDARRKISAAIGAASKIDIKEDYSLPSVVHQGPASQS